MVDEQKLRELAGAATVGGWKANGFDVNSKEHGWAPIANTELDYDGMAENAAFIAMANPQTILALLDELQTLRSERTAWRVTAENAEAAVKQAREDALEEAKQACDVSEPGWTGYECPNTFQDGVRACEVAIESLKGKT